MLAGRTSRLFLISANQATTRRKHLPMIGIIIPDSWLGFSTTARGVRHRGSTCTRLSARKTHRLHASAANRHSRNPPLAVAHEFHFLHEERRAPEVVLRHRRERDIPVVRMRCRQLTILQHDRVLRLQLIAPVRAWILRQVLRSKGTTLIRFPSPRRLPLNRTVIAPPELGTNSTSVSTGST